MIHADVKHLSDIVDREALGEVCRSFFGLFGLPIRIFAADDSLLADVHVEREVCRYANTLKGGRDGCTSTVAQVRKLAPASDTLLHTCFTGAVYRVVPIVYDGATLGRFVLGPYLPSEVREVPRSLLVVDSGIDPERARKALEEMPRVRAETVERIVTHLRGVLDLILFSGHKSFLTSEMHVLSERESFRELSEKNTELERAYDRLKEIDKLKSNFLATVSHELRTPLTSIIGYSEMLAAGIAGSLTTEQSEFVQTIRSKGDLLLKLITSLLDISRLEQGTLRLEYERVDVLPLFEEIIETVRPASARKKLTIALDVPTDGIPEFRLDPLRLRQIISNLLDNAIKFSHEGGTVILGARDVELSRDPFPDLDSDDSGLVLLAAPHRALEIQVRDEGIGIPVAAQERIFDAFYQVDGSSTREHGGTGLGLAIVRRLVEAHGGTIRVLSEVGKGTSFYVVLPEGELSL
ncbi:MAG: PocR ligand-binding domain-containing protein [Sandaracinaceae bacterium]|jgi:two-component system sensor histidine kinase BarA|nr:PocR ligand-binding domain-containing protein [Sandaracinaceae bacterium]